MPPVPGAHAAHDRILVAAYAAGDATGPELEQAADQVARCPACAALHADLRRIAAALPTLPPAVRPRDFRLSPAQAAALRPSGWRRLLTPLAGPRFAFAGPVGAGLAALGLAGILLAGTGLPLPAPGARDGDTAAVLEAAPGAGPEEQSGEDRVLASGEGSAMPAAGGASGAGGGSGDAAGAPGDAGQDTSVTGDDGPKAAAQASTDPRVLAPDPGLAGPDGEPAEREQEAAPDGAGAGARGVSSAAGGDGLGPIFAAGLLLAGLAMAGSRLLARRFA